MMPAARTLALIALLTTITTILPGVAHADEASDHVAKATRFYNIQEWPSALKEYKAAYALDPRDDTLWAIAQTQRLSGDCRSAILTYKAFLRTASASGAAAASELIQTCEADVAAHPTEPTVIAPPVGPRAGAAAAQPSGPAAPPAPPHQRSWVLDPLADTLFVVGVGALGFGGVELAYGARDTHNAPSEPTAGDYQRQAHDGHVDQELGIAVGAAGAVCAGLAIWRFAHVAHRNSEHAEVGVGVGVVPTAGGAMLSLGGSL